MVGTFLEPSCGRRNQPIHSIPYSVAQPLERGFNNYYSIIQGETVQHPVYIPIEGRTARESVTAENQIIGVTRAQEAAMLAGSLFGWDTPAADPKNYDEQGQPIKPKRHDRGDAR